MIQEFYGLELEAFSLSPDLDFLFLSNVHEEAVAHLIYGLENNEDIILIVGDIGTGKTLALHRLITHVSNAFIPVSINVTTLDFEQFLRLVLLKLGSDPQAGAPLAFLIDSFEKILINTRNKGKKVLLVIDEAQNLSLEVLESIRLLMNLGQPGGQALQLVLAGQLGLRTNLDSAGMRQLRQRIRVDYQFGFLNRQEIEEYVLHRLKTSGRTDPLFDKKALDRIFSLSRGVPRIVNILASKALLAGYVEGSKMISSRHLDDIDLEDLLETPESVPEAQEAPKAEPVEPRPEPEVIPLRAQKPKPAKSSPEPEVIPVRAPQGQPVEPIPEPDPEPDPNPDPEMVPVPASKPKSPRRRSSDFPEIMRPRPKGNRGWWLGAVVLLAVIAAAVSFNFWGPGLGFDTQDRAGSEVRPVPVSTQPEARSTASPSVLPTEAADKSQGLADSLAVAEPIELKPEETVAANPIDEVDEIIGATAGAEVEAALVPSPGDVKELVVEDDKEPSVSPNLELTDRGDEVFSEAADEELTENEDQFLVHVASFLLIERGVNFSTQLKGKGVDAFVRPSTSSSGKTWYRVYIGPYPTQQMAMEVAGEYKEMGWVEHTRITIPNPEWGFR